MTQHTRKEEGKGERLVMCEVQKFKLFNNIISIERCKNTKVQKEQQYNYSRLHCHTLPLTSKIILSVMCRSRCFGFIKMNPKPSQIAFMSQRFDTPV